jgi:hypothetical protein
MAVNFSVHNSLTLLMLTRHSKVGGRPWSARRKVGGQEAHTPAEYRKMVIQSWRPGGAHGGQKLAKRSPKVGGHLAANFD